LNKYFFTGIVWILGVMFTSAFAAALTNNFFIKDTFEKEGLTIKYSGVIKFNPSSNSNFNSDIEFNLYLASFFIEEVSYKGIIYRGHELFGHTFPKEILSKINIKALINFKNSSTLITSDISSFDKTKYVLSATQASILRKESDNPNEEFDRGSEFSLKLLATNKVEFPINKAVIDDMITAINLNRALKTKNQTEGEYSRLITEGNIRLNENNFKESLVSYTLAKKYTDDLKYVNSKIEIVDGYLSKNRTKYRWVDRLADKSISIDQKKITNNRINFDTDFTSDSNKKKYIDLDTDAKSFLVKNEYDNAIEKYTEAKKYTTNKAAIDQQIAITEKFKVKASNLTPNTSVTKKELRKNKKRTSKTQAKIKTKTNVVSTPVKAASKNAYPTVKIDPQISYPGLLKKGSEYLGKKEYIKSKAYFDAAKVKATNKETVDKILVLVNKLAKSEAITKGYTSKTFVEESKEIESNQYSNIKEEVSIVKNTKTEKKLPLREETKESNKSISLEDKAEILKAEFGEGEYKKGFIKYKRDEQGVLDAFDKVLIPYGKYEILRYRAGFANIRMKDPVELKTIECTGKNDEYSWSARIYQNPWIETVVDKNGDFVDDLNKRVEVYVVDNVSLLPWEEVPQSIKDAYIDPNQFTGTEFISAFKLWEHENANRPDILARRREIQSFKDASKNEAYRGANKCKNEVARSIESVYDYYKKMGYEIIVKY